jgi:hypothetical protein
MTAKISDARTNEQLLLAGLIVLLFEAAMLALWLGLDQHWALILWVVALMLLHGLAFLGFMLRWKTRAVIALPKKSAEVRALDVFYQCWRAATIIVALYAGEPFVVGFLVVTEIVAFVTQVFNRRWAKQARRAAWWSK